MSIHVAITSEAQQKLNIQKRRSTILSISVSLLILALVGCVLGLFLLPNLITVAPTIVTYEASVEEEVKPELIKPLQKVQQKPASATPNMAKVIAVASTNSQAAIPIPAVDVQLESADFGDGEIDFGTSFGDPQDQGTTGFTSMPAAMQKRCSKADRYARLQAEGGTPEGEEAVVKALDWLKKTQNPNGSWTNDHPAGLTGLALLAFLGHCETPQSQDYGTNVLNGITFLVDLGMKKEGMLTDKEPTNIEWVYDHGIATYALAEAYTFCKQYKINIPNLDVVTKKAGDLILQGQADSGGWVYKYANSNVACNSISFWHIQSLKACKHSKLWPENTFDKPVREYHEWLDKVQGENGAVGYMTDHNQVPQLTGGAMVAFQMWGKGNTKNVRDGIKWMTENTEFEWGNTKYGTIYHHYYNVQAMINYGGEEWKKYNLGFRDKLIEAQNEDGSWDPYGDHVGTINHTMATSMCALMLEAYYRFLPATGAK